MAVSTCASTGVADGPALSRQCWLPELTQRSAPTSEPVMVG